MPERFLQIDETNRGDHSKLTEQDICFFWLEYTAGQNWTAGRGNRFIANYKKKPGIAGPHELKYKVSAIREAAAVLSTGVSKTWREEAMFVPMPPSKIPRHPQYDDRLLQTCLRIEGAPGNPSRK